MFSKRIAMISVAGAMALTPATQVAADGGDIVGGIIGGVIGGVIVNEATRNRRTTTRRSTVSSATRTANRETQTSLNYFGFPAGTPDGVLGRRSRTAISNYQAHMGYAPTGQLTQYERDFLVGSYHRAISGGATTHQQIAASQYGPRGLLHLYRDEAAGVTTAMVQPQPVIINKAVPNNDPEGSLETGVITVQPNPPAGTVVAAATPPATETPAPGAAAIAALPNFLSTGAPQRSLASHCNQVSLLTNSNGGFVTEASMSDPAFALNEQFCLARTYAIASGEELAGQVQGATVAQIESQCGAFGPAMQEHIAGLSLKPQAQVMQDVSNFVLSTGMSPAQLTGTAKICLSVGYRTDNMEVALGSALLLSVLGEPVYNELMGHHLTQGFGTSTRPDLALAWYQSGFDAIENGSLAVFAPGNPERTSLIRRATFMMNGQGDQAALPEADAVQPVSTLPVLTIEN